MNALLKIFHTIAVQSLGHGKEPNGTYLDSFHKEEHGRTLTTPEDFCGQT